MIKNKIVINRSDKLSITMLSGFIAYHLLIIHAFTNPDGICKG